MKILHVIPRLDPEAGGPTTVVLGLVQALNRVADVTAEIITIRGQDHERLPLPSEEHSTIYQSVPVWFMPASRLRIRSFTPSLAFYRWVNANVKNYDIVHLHYLFSFTTLVAGVAAVRYGKPFVIRPLGQLAFWSLQQRRLIKKLWARWIDRPLLRRAALVHATSEQEVTDIRAFGVVTPTILLPPGVEAPPHAQERQSTTVLFLGRLHPKKRPELALEMIEVLVGMGIDAKLVYAGTGELEYERQLRERADAPQLRGRVSFHGFVEGDAKWELLYSAGVFVLPSQAENFGVAVAEAVASGCPVVLTREVDIASSLAASGAALVAEPTAAAFAAAVATIVRDPARAAAMSAAGVEFAAKHWSWKNVAARLIEQYSELLATRSATPR